MTIWQLHCAKRPTVTLLVFFLEVNIFALALLENLLLTLLRNPAVDDDITVRGSGGALLCVRRI